LTLKEKVGDVVIAGRPAQRYQASLEAREISYSNTGPAEAYQIDRDREWPNLTLAVVGFVGNREYARLEFVHIQPLTETD
jgi:hypothetical protein